MSERRIPPPLKDERGAYVKPEPPAPKPPYSEPALGDVTLDDLLARCIRILRREVKNLEESSSGGSKLSKDQSNELRENVKLLMELKKREKELLDALSDDELDRMAREKE